MSQATAMPSPGGSGDGNDNKTRLKTIIACCIGNLVEWYDWYVYSAFSIYFSSQFFPGSSTTDQLLHSAEIFAIGFLMRPLGGWLLGRLADRKSRKSAMTLSVIMISFGSLLIACTPVYASIGVAAPILLLLARVVQGLSLGGEMGPVVTLITEMAGKRRRGYYSSYQYVTLIGGLLVAITLQLLLQKVFLTEAELYAWGWRIPFIIGALLSLVAFYLRRKLVEPAFEAKSEEEQKKRGSIRELLRYPRQIITVMGLTLGGTMAFYTYGTYMQKFLVNTVGFAKETSTMITFFSLLIFAGMQPLFGLLSDKIGRRPLLIGFGVLGTITAVPILTLLSYTTDPRIAFGLILLALAIVSGYTSINAVVKAELFPREIRALGVGLPYAIIVALFGGTAETIALYCKEAGHEDWFYWYLTGCIFISLIVYATIKEPKGNSGMD